MENQHQSDHDLLVRIDERTTGLVAKVNGMLDTYVTKIEFSPVKKIVYGLITIILIAVVGAIVSLVIKR